MRKVILGVLTVVSIFFVVGSMMLDFSFTIASPQKMPPAPSRSEPDAAVPPINTVSDFCRVLETQKRQWLAFIKESRANDTAADRDAVSLMRFALRPLRVYIGSSGFAYPGWGSYSYEDLDITKP